MLASVPAARADDCITALRALGYAHAAVIGRILAQGEALEPVVLTG
jgi:selenide,water dikinase